MTVQSEESSSLIFKSELAGKKSRTHVDTGATHSFVAAHFVERAGLAVTPAARTVALADGQTVQVKGICRSRLRIGNITDVHMFYVLDLDSAYDVLLGQDWLRKKEAVLDFGHRSMTVTIRGAPRTVNSMTADALASGGGEVQDARISALQMKKLARKRGTECFLVLVKEVVVPDARCAAVTSATETISEDSLIAKEKLQRIVDKAVFAELPGGIIQRQGLPEMTIDFEEGKRPPVG